jgi:hypothetical protein
MGSRSLCVIVAMTVLIGVAPRLAELGRAGRSPDEDLTVLAVAAISSEGTPRMPSGMFYDRGLAYSYAAWGAGRFLGDGLTSYRLPSLVGGCCVVGLAALLARRLGGSALLAGLLCAGATWLIVASSWARFYGLFAASCLATTLVILAPGAPPRFRELGFLAGLAATRLLHESAVVLIALPLFLCLQETANPPRRDRSLALLLESVVLLGLVQLILYLLQGSVDRALATATIDSSLAPRLLPVFWSATTSLSLSLLAFGALVVGGLLRRLGSPWLLCLASAACVLTLNVGILVAMALGLVLARPSRALTIVVCTLAASGASLALWITHLLATTSAILSWDVFQSVAKASLSIPWSAGMYLWAHWPLAVGLAFVGVLLSFRSQEARAVAFFVLAFVVVLGLLELGPRPRYFIPVFPFLFVLASLVPASLATPSAASWKRRGSMVGLASLLAVGLLAEHEYGARDSALLEAKGPFGTSRLRSVPSVEWTAFLSSVPPTATLICNDDVACHLGHGRVDYWLLASDVEARIYGAPDLLGLKSTYTGARIIAGSHELRSIVADGRLDGAWLVLLDSFKYGFDEGDIAQSPSLAFLCEADGIKVWRLGPPSKGLRPPPRERAPCHPAAQA